MEVSSSTRRDQASLEVLLAHVIAEYQQVSTTPSGLALQSPSINSNGISSLKVKPLCFYEQGCSRNFGDFCVDGIPAAILFSCHVRCRIRYSCSTLATAFARFIAPKLKKMGLEKIFSTSLDQMINTSSLEIYTALFTPDKQHAIELLTPFGSFRTELVEAGLPFCSHNALKCRETGVVIDLSIGQFTGTLIPHVFKDENEWTAAIPGQVITVFKTSESDIQGQIERDNAPWRARVSPDATPQRFSRRVLQSFEARKQYCCHCLGVASVGCVLKRCSQCQQAYFCSRNRQVLHWKIHKKACRAAIIGSSEGNA